MEQRRVVPIRPQTDLPTPAQVAKAKAACEQERDTARALGVPIGEDGYLRLSIAPLIVAGYPLDLRAACSDVLDAVLEEFGLALMLSRVQLLAAANGVTVTVEYQR
jgi:hypothetical protein